jgi:hypothetical protein
MRVINYLGIPMKQELYSTPDDIKIPPLPPGEICPNTSFGRQINIKIIYEGSAGRKLTRAQKFLKTREPWVNRKNKRGKGKYDGHRSPGTTEF